MDDPIFRELIPQIWFFIPKSTQNVEQVGTDGQWNMGNGASNLIWEANIRMIY